MTSDLYEIRRAGLLHGANLTEITPGLTYSPSLFTKTHTTLQGK
jgi:hypothetical protein